nr:MAG TPA: hypothetical protein [Caudoviricetes sp.]
MPVDFLVRISDNNSTVRVPNKEFGGTQDGV